MEGWAGAGGIGSQYYECLRVNLDGLCQDWQMVCPLSHLLEDGHFEHFVLCLIQAVSFDVKSKYSFV